MSILLFIFDNDLMIIFTVFFFVLIVGHLEPDMTDISYFSYILSELVGRVSD